MRLAYYGDDFTGSTDALEWLSRAGVDTRLYIRPPSRMDTEQLVGLEAIGLAGCSRSLPPREMEFELRNAFQALQAFAPDFLHYKVCSTFDSSPQVGSIGQAIEVGISVFGNSYVPLIVGTPVLGRYCVFGNLFARVGIGSQGGIFRLDRHPVMKNHPVTPATDGDLRVHLALQTSRSIGLVDVIALNEPLATRQLRCNALIDAGNSIVLFDAMTDQHLEAIGEMLTTEQRGQGTQFVVGSSAVEFALCSAWKNQGSNVPRAFSALDRAEPLLVLSGSCSSVTAGQIATAVEMGFVEVPLDTSRVLKGDASGVARASEIASSALKQGRSVVVHTSRGNDDERLQEPTGRPTANTTRSLGNALAKIARNMLEEISLRRLGFAGGDTSSYAVQGLGIEALTMRCPFVPGAPICTTFASDSAVDGLEINLKGGQVGSPDYFVRLSEGR